MIGIPHWRTFRHLPKDKHWQSQAGVWQIWAGPGKAFYCPPNAIWNSLVSEKRKKETVWSLKRKHWEQRACSILPLYPDEFMKTHDVLSIHSIEPFPENVNYNLDSWALSGLTHFFQNTSRRNLSFPTTRKQRLANFMKFQS